MNLESYCITVAIPPYTIMEISSPLSQTKLLQMFQADWLELWPEVRQDLEVMCEVLKMSHELTTPVWTGTLGTLGPDYFMGDKADLYLEIELTNSPQWAFFIKGKKVVHCQPVF